MERESLVIEAKQLDIDEQLRRRANTLIGQVLLQQSLEIKHVRENHEDASRIPDLATAIDFAREGDERAVELVRSNVTTDYFERAYKYGYVSEVKLSRDDDGYLQQNDQTMHDVHLNSLTYIANEKLRQRAKIEALNALRDQEYANSGLLQDNVRVVFSLVHDGMSEEEAEAVGFYTHTRSVSIQLLTENEQGELAMQTAFVAGRENPMSDTFDKPAVIKLAKTLGIDYSAASSEDILARPLLIPKVIVPEGILSVVQQYDAAATAVSGKQKFFGKDAESSINPTDYTDKLKDNEQQKLYMKKEIESVVQAMLAESGLTPLQATEKLSKLNHKMLVDRIVEDTSIDSRVLGVDAAWHVEHARHYVHHMNADMHHHPDVLKLQRLIIDNAVSSSCPNGGKNNSAENGIGFELDSASDTEDTKVEDCDFISKECPKCGEKNVETKCRNGKYYGACGCVG